MSFHSLSYAKIVRPQVSGALVRNSLFQRLDKGREATLVWISGPGGSGKTTLVSSYIDTRKLSCLWYQVDTGDTDPATFFYFLGRALEDLPAKSTHPLPLLTPEYLLGLPDFSRNFFQEFFSRLPVPGVIVLDDVQEVSENALMHQCLLDGLSRLPAGLSLFLLSRSRPPAQYMRLLANQEMDQLDWQDLRLSFHEFCELAKGYDGQTLTENNLLQLYNQMDGWAAGLQLLLRDSSVRHLSGKTVGTVNSENLFSYFANQIFDRLDEKVREGLLRTAFVRPLTRGIIKGLSEIGSVEDTLESMVRQNYFTTKRYGPEPSYEYHPLFQAFLQEYLARNRNPDQLRKLKRLSAKILIGEAREEEAIPLLADLEDWPGVIKLILAKAEDRLNQGRYETIRAWIERLPDRVIEDHPWLLFWRAVSLKPLDICVNQH